MAFLTSAGVTGWEGERERERELQGWLVCVVDGVMILSLWAHHSLMIFIMSSSGILWSVGWDTKECFFACVSILIICGGSDVTSWVPVTLMASRMMGLSDLLGEN